MKGRAALALLVLAALNSPAPAAVYDLDPMHSFVHFEVRHFGTSTLRGRFGPLRGTVDFDPEARRGSVGLVIDTTSLDTGLGLLDARLREADLLDVAANPQAWFVAERFRFEAGQLAEVRGEFTLRGKSVPLSLFTRRFACVGEPQGGERCGGDFEGEVLRSEFGASFGLPFVADRVRLLVQVEGLRRPPR